MRDSLPPFHRLASSSPIYRTSPCLPVALIALVSLWWSHASRTSAAGIPEPSLVLYGTVRNVHGGESLRLTSGTLTWRYQPTGGGPMVSVTVALTNINNQFSYLMKVPCESVPAGLIGSSDALRLAPGMTTYDRSKVLFDGTIPVSLVAPASGSVTLSTASRGEIERVDLQVSVALPDLDGDGLPDMWERQYLGDLRFGAEEDSDGDGLSNRAEYKAGTNPNDPNSRFALIGVQPHPDGGLVIEWSSVDGESYAIERSSELLTGFAMIQSNIAATGPRNSYHDTTITKPGPYFYRLRLHE